MTSVAGREGVVDAALGTRCGVVGGFIDGASGTRSCAVLVEGIVGSLTRKTTTLDGCEGQHK
jgi:hypothetical protein